MVYYMYIPNSLALRFGENFMKIGQKSKVTNAYIHIMMQIFKSKYKKPMQHVTALN